MFHISLLFLVVYIPGNFYIPNISIEIRRCEIIKKDGFRVASHKREHNLRDIGTGKPSLN